MIFDAAYTDPVLVHHSLLLLLLALTPYWIWLFRSFSFSLAHTHTHTQARIKKPCKIDAASMLYRIVEYSTHTHTHSLTSNSHFFYDDNTHRQRKRTEKEEGKKGTQFTIISRNDAKFAFSWDSRKKNKVLEIVKV